MPAKLHSLLDVTMVAAELDDACLAAARRGVSDERISIAG